MISDFFSQSEEEFNLEFTITGTGSSHFCFYKNELEISEFVKKFQIIGDSLMLNHYNTHLLMIINGVWPSVRQRVLIPSCVGSNPTTPAN